MAISKIKTNSIANDAITSDKLATGGIATVDMADGSVTSLKILDGAIATAKLAANAVTEEKLHNGAISTSKLDVAASTGTGSMHVPTGTTAQRPVSPSAGYLRYNTTIGSLESYTAIGWETIGTPPLVTGVSPASFNGASGSSFTISGYNFTNGASVKFITAGSVEYTAASVTFNNSGSITATTPQNFTVAQEPLSVKVINPNQLSSTLNSVIDCGGVPAWSTSSGQIGSTTLQQTSFTATVAATDPEGGAITYSVAAGSSLPTGITINSSTGVISGTLPAIGGDTTYTFNINASDSAGNTTSRQFQILSIKNTPEYFIFNSAAVGGITWGGDQQTGGTPNFQDTTRTIQASGYSGSTGNGGGYYNIHCVGGSATNIGIWVGVYSSVLAIPDDHNKLEVILYVNIIDSNQSDTSGDISYGLGNAAQSQTANYLGVNVRSQMTSQGIASTADGFEITIVTDITGNSALTANDARFAINGSGGQYANVQFELKKVRTYFA